MFESLAISFSASERKLSSSDNFPLVFKNMLRILCKEEKKNRKEIEYVLTVKLPSNSPIFHKTSILPIFFIFKMEITHYIRREINVNSAVIKNI